MYRTIGIVILLLAIANYSSAALIHWEMIGQNATTHGAPTIYDGQNSPYIIDVTCEEDLSLCLLEFDVPALPAGIPLPSQILTQNDIMHASGTLGFTSPDFTTHMLIFGDPLILDGGGLSVGNFNQAVSAIQWKYHDLNQWPNFSSYYGAVSQDISTPALIPEPSTSFLAGIALLGLAIPWLQRLRQLTTTSA